MEFSKLVKKVLVSSLGALTILNYSPKQVSANERAFDFTLANGVLQSLVAGVGGYRNGCGFLKSAIKGFVGGSLEGMAKSCVGDDISCAWPAKLMNALGASIVNDTANCDSLGTSFAVDYGPVFLEWKNDRKDKFNWYILPDSLGVELALIGNGHKFSLEDSVKYGIPIFYSKDEMNNVNAVTLTNNILIDKSSERENTKKHESIHTFQYFDSYPLGNLILNFNDKSNKIKTNIEESHFKIEPLLGFIPLVSTYLFYNPNTFTNIPLEQEAYGLTE